MEANEFAIENGTILKGYPRQKPDDAVDKWPDRESQEVDADLFVANAHFLFENRDRIFADSRMFLAPVNVMSGGAYIGPFTKPTVGTYIEWWIRRGKGELAYHVSGSPLSGTNASKAIAKDGRLVPLGAGAPFNSIAREYVDAHERYLAERRQFMAYSLPEVLMRLKNVAASYEDAARVLVLERRTASLERRIEQLERDLNEARSKCRSWKDKYRNVAGAGGGSER